jgi:hypothetical protein
VGPKESIEVGPDRTIEITAQIIGYIYDSKPCVDVCISGFLMSGIGGSVTYFDNPRRHITYPKGISPNGDHIVGQAQGPWITGVIGWSLRDGTFTDIIYPGTTLTSIEGINSSGAMVGNYSTGATAGGFTYADGVFIADLPYPVEDIDDSGRIVGYTYSGGTYSAYVATPIFPITVNMLNGSTRPMRGSRPFMLRMQLLDRSGVNISSADLVAHATRITDAARAGNWPVAAIGNAHPGNDFRYSPEIPGYMFHLASPALTPGAYCLQFTVGGKPWPEYCAPFAVESGNHLGMCWSQWKDEEQIEGSAPQRSSRTYLRRRR